MVDEVLVHFNANAPGKYVLNIFWNDEHIPQSPFLFNVLRRLTAADIQVRNTHMTAYNIVTLYLVSGAYLGQNWRGFQ